MTCQDNYRGPLLFCLVRLNITPGTPRCGGPYVLFNPEIEQETCVGATKQGLLSKSVVFSKSMGIDPPLSQCTIWGLNRYTTSPFRCPPLLDFVC